VSYDKWVELLVVNFSSFPLKSSVLWHSSACIQSKISVADPDLGWNSATLSEILVFSFSSSFSNVLFLY
jgi:hypothetical protein